MMKAIYEHVTSPPGKKRRAEHVYRFPLPHKVGRNASPLEVRAFLDIVAQAEAWCVATLGRQEGKRVKNWELKGYDFHIESHADAMMFKLRWC